MIRSTSSPVPTGTVDLVTTTAPGCKCPAISFAAAWTYDRSAWPSPRREGVPTAMNTASAPGTASARSRVKVSLPAATLFATSSSRPGSKIGISPASSASTLPASLSTHVTSWPKSAKQAPETSPT
jgi:hypothetical protein